MGLFSGFLCSSFEISCFEFTLYLLVEFFVWDLLFDCVDVVF